MKVSFIKDGPYLRGINLELNLGEGLVFSRALKVLIENDVVPALDKKLAAQMRKDLDDAFLKLK